MTEQGQCWVSKKAQCYRGKRANGISITPVSGNAMPNSRQRGRDVSAQPPEQHLRFDPLALLALPSEPVRMENPDYFHVDWEIILMACDCRD